MPVKKHNCDSAFVFLLKIVLFVTLFLLASYLLTFFGYRVAGASVPDFAKYNYFRNSTPVSVDSQSAPIVIIDAGHGGMDSGAISVLGEHEKDLNFSLAGKIGAFLESGGVEVIYTRDGDYMLSAEGKTGSRKTNDLLGRVQLAKEYPNALFVSIHMNTLAIEKCNGLQVFYSPNSEKSKVLALTTQNKVRELLQPENRREAKKAGSNIYILDRIQSPAILIECGFISNRAEAALLRTEDYQNKLGFVISESILQFVLQK